VYFLNVEREHIIKIESYRTVVMGGTGWSHCLMISDLTRCRWLTPIILATWEGEIRRITV
jgi:hypothetical protein